MQISVNIKSKAVKMPIYLLLLPKSKITVTHVYVPVNQQMNFITCTKQKDDTA